MVLVEYDFHNQNKIPHQRLVVGSWINDSAAYLQRPAKKELKSISVFTFVHDLYRD